MRTLRGSRALLRPQRSDTIGAALELTQVQEAAFGSLQGRREQNTMEGCTSLHSSPGCNSRAQGPAGAAVL